MSRGTMLRTSFTTQLFRSISCAALFLTMVLGTYVANEPAAASATRVRNPAPVAYEVWMTDQNNTAGFSMTAPRGTHGGRLLVYDGADLDLPGIPLNTPTTIDFATMYALGPANTSGANVVRPHMAVPSPDHRYVAIAFVASGHIAIIDGATKASKALFRMSAGFGGARQAHAGFWTPDGTALIVANQNGKLLERINYDFGTDTFTHDQAATLNLVTCVTPSGRPCQSNTPVSDLDPLYLGPDNRPDNAPICPVMSSNNSAFVTLRGGGLFVVDAKATPMAIIAAYGNQFVGRDGCGGTQDKKNVYLNGGTGTILTNPTEFSLYHFRDQFPAARNSVADNDKSHAPDVFYRDSSPNRDAHGMVKTEGNVKYLWQFDRLANVAEVFRLPSKKHVNTVDLTASGVSNDPTPDLGALAPHGTRDLYRTSRSSPTDWSARSRGTHAGSWGG